MNIFSKRLRLGLRSKFISIVIIIMLLIAGMLSMFFLSQQRTILTEELKKRGIALTRNLAYNCEYGVITEDEVILGQLIEGIKKHEDISYAVVFNKEGKVLAASSEESIFQQFPGKDSLKNGEGKVQHHVFEKTGPVFDITVPVVIEEETKIEEEDWLIRERQKKEISTGKVKDRDKAAIGLVRVGISLKNTNTAIIRNRNISISAIAFVSIASGIIFSVLIAMVVTRPLRKLVQGANSIGRGDFNHHIDIKTSDEISILCETFNDMTVQIKKRELALQEAHDILEDRVKERTRELAKINKELENEVSVRKQTEKKLRTEKAYIDQLFESAQEAIVMADKDGRVLRVNSEFIRLFGYTIDELLSSSLDDLIAPKEYYDSAVATTKKVTEGEKVAFETVRQRKNGTLLNVSVLASPIIVDGELVAVYGIYRDITALKRAEEALEERSKELAEANIRLKELDRLKSMFIASMSHELRTPLNSIIGFTGLILQGLAGEINAEQKDQLQRVYGSAKHLLALISDVIDISKIEAGKVEVYTEEFQLEGVIKEAVSSIKAQIDDKRVGLEIRIPQDLQLKTDRKRLLQCVLNYLSNAVKFTEKGEIRIGAEEVDAAVKITVKDTGIGIKEEDLPKLFNAFVRLDSPYKFTTLGTGLGLYLTKKLATEVLRGSVSVESSYGKGSTFMLEVPKEIRDEK